MECIVVSVRLLETMEGIGQDMLTGERGRAT